MGKTVRQKKVFHDISRGTEEIGNAFHQLIAGIMEEGDEEKNQRKAHCHVAEKQKDVIRFLVVTLGNEFFFLKTFINILYRFAQVMDGIHSHMLHGVLHLMKGMANFMDDLA